MSTDGTEILSDEECWALLERTAVGRLAFNNGSVPDIRPINFVVDDGTIVFRSGAGTKLAGAALLHHVAFEIDGYEPGNRVAWSVIVAGWAEQLERMEDRYEADDLPLFPWVASYKPEFIRIHPREVTGRRFHIVDDVSPDSSIGWEPIEATGSAAVRPEPGVEYHPGEPHMRPD